MTTLALEFVGPYAAADVASSSRPEWPPHPDRVFQALVAAAYETGQADAVAAALRWIESQGAPSIACSDEVPIGGRAKVFVPVNYENESDPVNRTKQPRQFPLALLRAPRVLYMYPDAPAEIEVSLARVAEAVTHVGRAESHVIAGLVADRPRATLVPQEDGSLSFRVPHEGRLAELDGLHSLNRRPTIVPSVSYARADELRTSSPWADFIAFRVDRPLSLRRTVLVTEALRKAVLSIAGDGAPPELHGHDESPHAAWLALPNLSPYARDEIFALAVLLPARMDSTVRAECVQAILSVEYITLDSRKVGLATVARKPVSMLPETWMGPSSRWATVTPVVFDRFPRRTLGAEAAVQDMFERAGYMRPSRVEVSDRSMFAGISESRPFRLRRPGKLYAHVVVQFDEEISGPVVVGAERHFGLGLFRPM